MEIRALHRDSITAAEAAELARLQTLVDPGRLPADPPVSAELAVANLRSTIGTFGFAHCGAFDGDDLVAYGSSFGRIDAENTDLCELGIWVDPSRLGEGLHRAVLDRLVTMEPARDRPRVWGWGDLHDPATTKFWEAEMGFELAYDERVSRCDVHAVDADLMRHWSQRAAERAGEYRLERVVAPMDDTMLSYFAAGLEAMNDAPHDDLRFDPERFDLERARQVEQLHLATRSEYRLIFAIHEPTGHFAGYTGVRVPDAEPSRAKQGDTVTVAAHRNRGIGRWLKSDMWHWLRSDRPEVRYVDTGNAESNRAMLDINEAMGFQDVRHEGVWHRPA